MIYKHVNINFDNLLINYDNRDIIYDFLDSLTLELAKYSKVFETTDDIIYIDYKTQKKYIVSMKEVNSNLSLLFNELYLKRILVNIGMSFSKNENIDFFIKKNLLCLLKNVHESKKDLSMKDIKELLLKLYISENTINDDEYIISVNNMNLNYNILIDKFKNYFGISTETFSFASTEHCYSYPRVQYFFDIKHKLKYKAFLSKNLNEQFDLIFQYIILLSFINANYYYNIKIYTNNSYLRHWYSNSVKELPIFSKLK